MKINKNFRKEFLNNRPSHEIWGSKGGVTTMDPIATNVGIDILNKGGNAIDAAIACAFALNVVEPWMCGLGGSGYILIWLAKTKVMKVIDFQGILPKSISFEDYPIDNNLPETIMAVSYTHLTLPTTPYV